MRGGVGVHIFLDLISDFLRQPSKIIRMNHEFFCNDLSPLFLLGDQETGLGYVTAFRQWKRLHLDSGRDMSGQMLSFKWPKIYERNLPKC